MKQFLILLSIVLSFSQCGKDTDNQELPVIKETTKVLFVGNSYTYYNQGIDFHLEKLLEWDTLSEKLDYVISSVTIGGYTLEDHWNDEVTNDKILSDEWDFIVLQEQSTRPINETNLFYDYARSFHELITNLKSKTAFYMTWARKDRPADIEELDNAYSSINNELQTTLAPVGRVFEYVINKYPEITLHIDDNKHPTLAGTYLAACVFEITLFNKNPNASAYIPLGLSESTATKLRNAAWVFMDSRE